MLRRDAKFQLLREVPLFSACSKRELAQIALIAEELDFPAGKTLIKQGVRGRQFFVVVDGAVAVEQDGRRLPVRGGSEVFGEISLVSGGAATATVTTTAPTHALVITPHHFRDLLKKSPSIQLKVLHSLAERLAPHMS
jgi:CRP/FNR family transcriptional regulator, cyclic AMP receptor protein